MSALHLPVSYYEPEDDEHDSRCPCYENPRAVCNCEEIDQSDHEDAHER